MPLQLTVVGQSPTSGEAVNVWNFDSTTGVPAASAALEAAYNTFAPSLSDDATFNIDPVARYLDDATGALQSMASASWTGPVSGAGVGSRGADATAALVSWQTDTIHNGRVIRGRTFLPFPSISVLGEGHIAGASLTNFQNAVDQAVIDLAGGSFGIWSRPVNGAGGGFGLVVAGIARPEYAVQRRRRN